MAKKMIIKGELLARYLQAHKVSRLEFLLAMNEGDAVLDKDEDGDIFVQLMDSRITGADLFKRRASLNLEESRKFINLIGAKDAVNLIDWEAMDIGKPNFKFPDSRVTQLLVAIGKIRKQNARQSYAV